MDKSAEEIRSEVKQAYGATAEGAQSCCQPTCCGGQDHASGAKSAHLGYAQDELAAIPEEADLGLGCGNPTALAGLKPGEVVLDLGAGAGIDALIAAPKVGPEGRVIGVDMTPQMLTRARQNAVKAGHAATVEFREGQIEDLPVVSNSVDVVISNCVINLSPEKQRVFQETFRVLKSGGRLAVSDIVLSTPLPQSVAQDLTAYMGCVAGAATEQDYIGAMRAAGFVDIEWTRVSAAPMFEVAAEDPNLKQISEALDKETIQGLLDTVWSYKITARKP